MENEDHEQLRQRLAKCLQEALKQVWRDAESKEEDMGRTIRTSFSFPNRTQAAAAACTDGKPYDVETRATLSLFHRLRKASKREKKESELKSEKSSTILLISDFGLERSVSTPYELAVLLLPAMEAACQTHGIADDLRVSPSGIIHILTRPRSRSLRQAGRLPCPHCTKWLKGEKGLWWHQQQVHKVEHAQATAVAGSYDDSLAIVPFKRQRTEELLPALLDSMPNQHPVVVEQEDDPFELCKNGSLDALRYAVKKGFDPATQMDQKGATALMWAAGSGQLDTIRYLLDDCDCDVNQSQMGKRSFSGRTALHWAARNGHLRVVQCLILEYGADIESVTADGTTAFCWACWQGHLNVMQFLAERGCGVHRKNSFGCNAVLWCAQGSDQDGASLQWLQEKGCDMRSINTNHHGVLHKAAQRGHDRVCRMFCESVMFSTPENENGVVEGSAAASLALVVPDTEGYCPSDLAGMGYEELANWIAHQEIRLVEELLSLEDILSAINSDSVSWLSAQTKCNSGGDFVWEKWGGVRRMQHALSGRLRMSQADQSTG